MIETDGLREIAQHIGSLGDYVVPSPDGRYIAVFGDWPDAKFWTYDTKLGKWADLGPFTLHPDKDWDYIKPTWNPWFADTSRLVYVKDQNLVISDPEGDIQASIPIGPNAGIPVASPDGKFVAYISSDPRPRGNRPDLSFWGGRIVWLVPTTGGKPYAVTEKNSAETYDLKWLSNDTLVFDRIEDVPFFRDARIWKLIIDWPKVPKS